MVVSLTKSKEESRPALTVPVSGSKSVAQNRDRLSALRSDLKAATQAGKYETIKNVAAIRKACLTQREITHLGNTPRVFLQKYLKKTHAARDQTVLLLDQEFNQQSKTRRRWRSMQLEVLLPLLRQTEMPKTITLAQYWRCAANKFAPSDLPSFNRSTGGAIVVVSEKEACWLFSKIFDPEIDIPILIYPDKHWRPRLSIADLEKKLQFIDVVSVQDSSRSLGTLLVQNTTGKEASQQLRNNKGSPLNLLEIHKLTNMDLVWCALAARLESPDNMTGARPVAQTPEAGGKQILPNLQHRVTCRHAVIGLSSGRNCRSHCRTGMLVESTLG